jgi:hypothetical protein
VSIVPHQESPGKGRDYVLSFGRHRGRRLAECPEPYLSWLAREARDPALRRLAKQILAVDLPEDDIQPSPEAASVVLPLLVFEFARTMEREVLSDPRAGDFVKEVVEKAVGFWKRECAKITGKAFVEPVASKRPDPAPAASPPAPPTSAAKPEGPRNQPPAPSPPARPDPERCRRCGGTERVVEWQSFQNGTTHLRQSCRCGAFQCYAPRNAATVSEANARRPYEAGGAR